MKLLKSTQKNEKENNLDWAEVTKEVAKGKNPLQQMTINASYVNRDVIHRKFAMQLC